MGSTFEKFGVLLLIAMVVSMLARRLKLPYTVGLTLAGLGVALLATNFKISLTKELIFEIFLPPLIFEAALQMEWKRFKAELPVTISLATVGVLLSSALMAAGAHYGLGWSWPASLITAILISATDPVSVVASFRDLKVGGRLQMLVESESLLNDATAAVLFVIALGFSQGTASTPGAMALAFCLTVGGGILCGAAVGGLALLLAGKTDDHLVEIGFTTLAAYASFLVAEKFHVSGVLATMTAGILMGNIGYCGAFTDAGREAVETFWEFVGFAANSLIFLLIGMSLAGQPLDKEPVACAAIVALALLGRALAVYGCSAAFSRSSHKISMAHQHVLFWGGLRGALGLALALGLPVDFEDRSKILVVTFAVVSFSVVVQGLTISPLLTRLGIVPKSPPKPH